MPGGYRDCWKDWDFRRLRKPGINTFNRMNQPIGKYRWTVVTLLFFATAINYLDRQVIGLLKPTLEKALSWSETDYGNIVMAFSAAYAAGLLFFGRIIDRIGTKAGYVISIIAWSVAAIGHAFVQLDGEIDIAPIDDDIEVAREPSGDFRRRRDRIADEDQPAMRIQRRRQRQRRGRPIGIAAIGEVDVLHDRRAARGRRGAEAMRVVLR